MILNQQDLQDLCSIAKQAALEAGQYIQSKFDQHYIKKSKVGGDSLASQVVTEVDIKAQEIILTHLNESIAKHDLGLLTEESTDNQSRLTKDYFWCIDPMDGTLPFTERRTGYAVSIALNSKAGDPVIGVVYVPDLGDCFTAVKNDGVKLNDTQFSRNTIQDEQTIHIYMDRSYLSESYYDMTSDHLKGYASKVNKGIEFHTSFGGVRNAIGVLQSQHGCYFKFPKPRKGCGSIWDYAATRLCFEEAGLVVSNARGERLSLNDPDSTFMNNGGILFATDSSLSDFLMEISS
ncbi:MAG: inositol monophosphatase family protein [bacterium]|nr:inositol monophosphatase family protein [bacterium]